MTHHRDGFLQGFDGAQGVEYKKAAVVAHCRFRRRCRSAWVEPQLLQNAAAIIAAPSNAKVYTDI
jgi:hypothetical protein